MDTRHESVTLNFYWVTGKGCDAIDPTWGDDKWLGRLSKKEPACSLTLSIKDASVRGWAEYGTIVMINTHRIDVMGGTIGVREEARSAFEMWAARIFEAGVQWALKSKK